MAGLFVGTWIESLLAKLNELILDSCTDLLAVSNDIVFLKEELLSMNALLVRLDDHHHYYGLNAQEKLWRTETRRMAYDIEDYIDDFKNNNVARADAKDGFLAKVSQFVNTLRAHFEAAKKIKELKARIMDINERRKRYKVEFDTANTSNKVDPRIYSLYNESGSLVGIDIPREKLTQWVLDGEKRLKVLPIVGFGGLGKTTLANEVYREVGRQFDGKAFVSVSQKPDVRKVLRSVLVQLGQQPSSHADDNDLIADLRNYLQDKRYIIVIDDLWDVPAWIAVRCAFPANEKHSRIITTTRDESVARSCSSDHRCIYKMKHLDEQDSRQLFFNRIFGFEHHCPPEFTEVSCAILKKCGGLPLAIITIASILACQPTKLKEQWDNIQRSLVAEEFATNPTLEDMMHILDLSYKSLPRHLRPCFMYLRAYPEHHKISKVELIRRWVAEGFVGNCQGGDVWDVAESYFNELVNRSMVQPGYEDDNMKISYCTVHDMMFELIARRCREDEDFVSLVVDPHVLANGQSNIRQLTVDLSNVDDGIMDVTNTEWLSKVRSLAICGGGSKWRPPLLELKFLRVLFLEYVKAEMTIDLTCITHLLQLKYLKVKCEECRSQVPAIVLPGQIEKLRHLQTLEMPRVSVCNIPSDIGNLSHLSHLVLPWKAKLPDSIGNIKSLRTLRGFNLSMSSLDNIKCLGKLSNMEDMYLNCDLDYTGCPLERMTALTTSLLKLDHLKYLCVHSSYVNCRADALSCWSSPPFLELKELDVLGLTFSEVPKWIGRLYCITDLRLGVKKMLQKDISVIGTNLPSLVYLRLRVTGVPAERILIGGSMGFSLLKSFYFDCDGVSCLTFEEGAMPSLRTLWLGLDAREWDGGTPHGLHHLASLKEVQVWTERQEYQQTRSETPRIKEMFHNAVVDLPGGPAFTLLEGLLKRCREGPHI